MSPYFIPRLGHTALNANAGTDVASQEPAQRSRVGVWDEGADEVVHEPQPFWAESPQAGGRYWRLASEPQLTFLSPAAARAHLESSFVPPENAISFRESRVPEPVAVPSAPRARVPRRTSAGRRHAPRAPRSAASTPDATESPPAPSGADAPCLLDEELLRLDEAARLTHVSVKTIRRWIRIGRNGRQLEAIKLGGQLRTSREALERFALFPAGGAPTPSCPDGSALQRHRRAERRLDRLLGPVTSPDQPPQADSSSPAGTCSTRVRAREAPRKTRNQS